MKIYARLHNSKNKVEGIGDTNRITIELSYKNDVVGYVSLYRITNNYNHDIGYRVVWKDDNTQTEGEIIKEYDKYSLKGKKQKGESNKLWDKMGKDYPKGFIK